MIQRSGARKQDWKRFDLGALPEAPSMPQPGATRPVAAGEAEAAARQQRDAGYDAGFATGQARAKEAAARMAALAQSFGEALSGAEAQLAEQLLDVAVEITRQMLRTDIKLRREGLLPVVREAMRALPDNAHRPQLQLNPADAELVRSHIGDELAQGGWSIVEDHRIEPGGCRISTPHCDIDATLAERWRKVLVSLGRESSWIDG